MVSRQSCVMDIETVSRYVDAVGDETFDSPVMRREDSKQVYVPAMAVAAISVRGVVNDLQIPGGTLHLGQELQFLDIVPLGETLVCMATLAQNSVRGGQRILVVSLDVENGLGRTVMTGKSTIAVPA
ncbi:MAG: MaoC family dehydratase [Chloroflexi bacterium]|nr:MaoC family dehydratase [Chloroflexota bacterium]